MTPEITFDDYIKVVDKDDKVLYEGKFNFMPKEYLHEVYAHAEYLPDLSGLPVLNEVNYFKLKLED